MVYYNIKQGEYFSGKGEGALVVECSNTASFKNTIHYKKLSGCLLSLGVCPSPLKILLSLIL
jgi:hypothetical protein